MKSDVDKMQDALEGRCPECNNIIRYMTDHTSYCPVFGEFFKEQIEEMDQTLRKQITDQVERDLNDIIGQIKNENTND